MTAVLAPARASLHPAASRPLAAPPNTTSRRPPPSPLTASPLTDAKLFAEDRQRLPLWRRWFADRSEASKAALLESYYEPVRDLCHSIFKRNPLYGRQHEPDDFVAYAYKVLPGLIDRWEPKVGPFWRTVDCRVRGQIKDELRKHDYLPRRARRGGREGEPDADRKPAQRRYVSGDAEWDSLYAECGMSDTPSEQAESRGDAEALWSQVRAVLSQREYTVVRLLHRHGSSREHVGAIVGLSPASVTSVARDAMDLLEAVFALRPGVLAERLPHLTGDADDE